ncbi:MAG TPA: radical SAM protein, partial [Flavisolibacter sp.]|nr:radical SAM protein [Flavisolibacter sp.]
WLGNSPITEIFIKSKKGMQWEMMTMTFHAKKAVHTIQVERKKGVWLQQLLTKLAPANLKMQTLQQVKESFENAGLEDFELFWDNKPINTLYKAGLLVV